MTINKHDFVRCFVDELKNADILPRKYCTIGIVSKIMRCYHKTILRCLDTENEIILENWGKYGLGATRTTTIHNPWTGKYEECSYTEKPHFFFNKAMYRRFEEWRTGNLDSLDDVLGREMYLYSNNPQRRKREEKKKKKAAMIATSAD